MGHRAIDHGDIYAQEQTQLQKQNDLTLKGEMVGKFNRKLCEKIQKVYSTDSMLLTVGGDHSIALGSIAGVLSHSPNTGVVWVVFLSLMKQFKGRPRGYQHVQQFPFKKLSRHATLLSDKNLEDRKGVRMARKNSRFEDRKLVLHRTERRGPERRRNHREARDQSFASKPRQTAVGKAKRRNGSRVAVALRKNSFVDRYRLFGPVCSSFHRYSG